MPTQMNKLNFEGQNIYAGFGVHINDLKMAILSEEIMLERFTMIFVSVSISNAF